MPSNNNRINFQVGYNVDQSSVNAVKKSLQDLQNIKLKDFSGTKQDLENIRQVAGQVLTALNKAFNVNLNSLNTQKFNSLLASSKLTIDGIYQSFSKAGAQGQVAFSRMASSVLTTNMQLKLTNSLISSMGLTMANTVKWGVASSVMNNFTNSVQQAFQYVKSLDSALTDIRIVTGDSTEQMRSFAAEANKAALSLGRSTMDYTKAALSFYQQGLSDEEVQARTESVLKAQNITGAGLEMADYLTAVWNGYKVANEEAELYVDKLAAVADSSASNMSLLAIAMSKVASTANTMGVDVDQLNAQIATIVATTRQAPESVGNALKTVYTRINDIATGADDALISLGNYSKKMAEVGINVLDTNGRLRDTGLVIEEVGSKWAGMSKEQQIYLARTMAGQRQINNMTALFDNWSKYTDLVNVSLDAQGTTMEKNERYMDSLGAKMEQFGAAGERVKDALINEEDLKGIVDFGTNAVDLFANLVESIGGGGNALLTFGSIFTQLFSGTIAKEINSAIVNAQNYRNNLDQINQAIQKAKQEGENSFARGISEEYVNNLKQMLTYHKALSNLQIQLQQNRANLINSLRQLQSILKENTDQAKIFFENISGGKNLLNTSIGRISHYLNKAKQELSELNEAYETILSLPIKKEGPFNDGELEQQQSALQQLAEKVRNNVELLGENATKNDKALANIVSGIAERGKVSELVLDKLLKKVLELQGKVNRNINNVENFGENQKQYSELEKKAKELQDEFNRINAGARQAFDVKAVVNFAAGLGQVASGLNNIKQLGNIWNNSDLSAGEKILQTMTNIGMTLPMLLNGLRLIKTSWSGVIDSVKLAATQIMVRNGLIIATDAGAVAAEMSLSAATRVIAQSFIEAKIAILGFNIPLLALVGAVGAVVAVGYGLYKVWNQNAEAALKAALKTKEAKQAYEDLKDTYSNLKSSLDDLHSAEDNLSNLTKGTQEWRDALLEVNQKVIALIQEFPELKEFITTTQDGLLGLTDAGLEKVALLYRQRTTASGLAYAAADQQSTLALNRSIITDASRKGDLEGLSAKDLENVVTAINQHGSYILEDADALKGLTNLSDKEISTVLENSSAIIALSTLVKSNTAASEALTSSLVESLLANIKQYQESSNQAAFARMAENAFKNVQLDSSYYDQMTTLGGTESILDPHKVALAYNEITGQEIKVSLFGDYKVKDLSGKWQKMAASTVENMVAYQDAVENADKIYDLISKTIESMGLKAAGLYSLFVDGLLKVDWSKLSQKDISNILADGGLIDEIAKMLEVNSDDVVEALNGYSEDVARGTEEYIGSLPAAVQHAFNNITKGNTDNLSLLAQRVIGDMLEESLEKGIDSFKSTKDILEGLDLEDVLPFKDILNELDPSNLSVDEFKDYLALAEIQLNATDLQLLQFINDLKGSAEALTPELNYANLHDVVDGLKTGDTISDLQKQALEAAGVAVDEYFTHMADGSYKLQGDAKEFYDYVNQLSIQPFIDEMNEATANLFNAQNALDNFDYESLTSNTVDDHNHVNNDLVNQQLEALSTLEDSGFEEVVTKAKAEIEELGQVTLGTARLITLSLKQAGEEGIKLGLANKAELANLIIQDNLEQLRNAIPIDEDIDVEVLESLKSALMLNELLYNESADASLRLSLELKDNAWAAEDVAEAILRFDQALQDIQKNYEDWIDVLLNGTIQLQALLFDDLADSYGDLLDIDGTQLSSDFLSNADNLRLFKEAALGSEQAYNQLLAAAGQDIIAHILLRDADAFYTLLGNVQSLMDQMNFQNILIGADLKTDGFYAALENMVNAAGMTADQATSYLASMGVDAEIILNKQNTTDTKTQTGWAASLQPVTAWGHVPIVSASPDGSVSVSLQPIQTTVMSAVYTPTTLTAADIKENSAFSLKVTSAKKSSGGGFKYKQSSHGGGTQHPTPSSSRGGGGGGGRKSSPKKSSGSSAKPTTVSKAKTSEDKKPIDDKPDPYHDINILLDKQLRKLKKILNLLKKLTGQERVKNLQKQNKELLKQGNLLDLKIAIANHLLITTRNDLIADLDKGITFNSNGLIGNYESALRTALDNYNHAVQVYNNLVKDAEAAYNDYVEGYNKKSKEWQDQHKTELLKQKDIMLQAKDAADKTLKSEKEKYDRIKDNIKAYDDTLNLINDLKDQQEEITLQVRDNIIALSQIKVDASLDVSNLERDWIDFENKFIKKLDKDDLFASAKASARLLMSYFDSEEIISMNDLILNLNKEIDIMRKGGGADVYGDRLTDAQERLDKLLKQQTDSLKNIQDLVDNIKDTYLDALDDAKDKMDDQIDQYERVNDLINHNVKLTLLLYGDKAYGTMLKYYNLQKANNDAELQNLKTQQDYWQRMMNSFIIDGEIIDQKAFEKAKNNFDDLTNQVNSKLEDMILNLSNQWENRVDGIIAKLNNALTGGRGLDYLDEQWDYINNFDDNFLDTFESRMGIQEVTNLYQLAIDGLSGSPANQQKINKLMNDQLKILREKDNLTQYDIDRAKAALLVLKARMALEDSRYNKTKMRLRRDSQGNYTYQYVADELKLGDLQSALADAQANLYNTDKEHYQQNLNDLYDTYKNYLERMRDLQELYRAAEAAGDAAEMQRVQARMDLAAQQFSKLYEGLSLDNKYALLYLAESFSDGMGIDRAVYSAAEFSLIMNNNIPQMASNIQNLRDTIVADGGLINATSDAMKEINVVTQDYNNNIQLTIANAGTSLENIMQVTDDFGNALDTSIQQALNLIPKYTELINTSVKAIASIKDLMDQTNGSLDALISDETLENLGLAYNTLQKVNEVGRWFSTDSLLKGGDNLISDEARDWGLDKAKVLDYTQYITTNSTPVDFSTSLSSSIVDAIEKVDLSNLSDVDTESLSALLQYITNSMDTVASNQIASISSGASGYIGSINNVEHLDQNVHIEANFPNVTQHTEIEQAFNNLVNMASMRASGYRD